MINALIVIVIFQAFMIGFLSSYFYGKLKDVHEILSSVVDILEMMTNEKIDEFFSEVLPTTNKKRVVKKKKGKK